MKNFLLLLLFTLLGFAPLLAQDCGTIPPADNKVYRWCYTPNLGTSWNTAEYKAYIINGLHFRLLFPKGFDSTAVATKKYPLVVMLHGLGMSGPDNNLQLKIGGEVHLNAVQDGRYKGFVMVPQANGETWTTGERNTVITFIHKAIRDLGVDPFRVQLEGYSAGGTAAWKLAYANPQVFAGAVIMSSADGSMAKKYAQVLKNTAIWHAQGGRDSQPQPTAGDRVAEEFGAVGANYRYQYYHELGHGTWEAMYREPDFFPFLMRNSILRIHARHFKFNFCTGEAISGMLAVKEGFEGYEWRKDGSPIGGNAHELAFSGLGAYTVRIKYKGAWSAWSEPLKVQRVAPTATPVVVAVGPTALPTLDGRTAVTLRAPKGFQHYAWSDGSALDSLEVSKAGAYSVSVTQTYGCPSAASAPVQVTFNAVGVLATPEKITVGTASETSLNIQWEDKSNDETGFELYRSRAPEGPWSLVAQLPANATSYQDTKLSAYTRYFYSLRSVNQLGGSTYARGSGKTRADTSPPASPGRLEVGKTSRTSIDLHWQASKNNTAAEETLTYQIYLNNTLLASTTNTAFTVKGLPEQQFFTFAVRAVDEMGNHSAFSNQVTAGTFINGLQYTYYEGALETVHNISLLTPVKTGRLPNFDIRSPRRVHDDFAFKFEGYLDVPASGTYTFFTSSDDGSTLSLDGVQLVNNDKKHERQEKSATVELTQGLHALKVLYFETLGSTETLEVYWQGPGISKQPIPDAAFAETIPLLQAPAAPVNMAAEGVDDQRITLRWTPVGTDSNRVEIYRSTAPEGPFTIIKTVSALDGSYTDSALQPSTTYYYQLRTVGSTGESAYVGHTAAGKVLSATTKEGGIAAPTELSAYWTSGNAAVLQWTDNASSESAYEIWRGTDGSTFAKVASIPANLTDYTDQGLDSLVLYHYRVRAVVGAGFSEWSSVAVVSNTNKPPLIADFPATVVVPEGKITEISFQLSDPENKPLQLISRYLPHFAAIGMVSTKQGKIKLSPSVKDIGQHTGIQFTASDGVLETDITFSIKVVNSEKTAIYINVGNNSVAEAPWNNTNTFAGQKDKVVLENLQDEYGAETGYSLTLLDAWSANKPYGETSGPGEGIYPDVVTNSAYIINPGKTARMKVAGLKADKRYNFVFFGSNVYKSYGGSTRYSIGAETVSLAVQSNKDKTVQINGVKADARGEVVISVAGADGASKGGYLNALVIEQYPEGGKVLRPGRFKAHAVSKEAIDLSWTDNSFQETGFEVWRRSLPDGTFDLITTTGPNVTNWLDQGLQANTGYEYKVRAVTKEGYSGYSEVKQAATLLYKVLVNTNYTKNMGEPWVNLDQRPVTGYTWYNFRNEALVNTGINLRLDQSFDGNNAFGPDAKGEGIYHDNVIKTFYYTEVGTVAKMRLYGLDDAFTYNFRFFASSAFEGGESGVTAYRIGKKKVTLDAEYNVKNTAVIRDIQPTNGSVLIEVEAGPYARYGFINAFEIEVRDKYQEMRGATPEAPGAEEPELPGEGLNQIATLYPNPGHGELTLEFIAENDSKCLIQILDLTGRLLQTQEVTAQKGSNLFKLDLRAVLLSKGMYLVKIKSAMFESKGKRYIRQ